MVKAQGFGDLFLVFRNHMDTIALEMKLPLISDEDVLTLIDIAKKEGCSDAYLMNIDNLRIVFQLGYTLFVKGDYANSN
jgi:hypothetical protein